jgi:hypothetical protein
MKPTKIFDADIRLIRDRFRLSKRAQLMIFQSELWMITDDFKLQLEFSKQEILN